MINESEYMPLKALKAAMLVTPKDDIRSILNGICFDRRFGKGRLIATNGHVLYKYKHPLIKQIVERNTAIVFKKIKVPKDKRTKFCQIKKVDEEWNILFFDESGTLVKTEIIKELKGIYPDWRRAIPSAPSSLPNGKIAFDTKYLGWIRDVFGKRKKAVLEFHDETGVAQVTSEKIKGACLYIMPAL